MGHKVEDNERLEFLGDAVLDLIIANLLYNEKCLSEADMTEKRKGSVSNPELAKLFNKIGIKEYILIAKNLNLSNKIKADFIEALFGALFVDKGYPKCLEVWKAVQKKVSSETKNQKKQFSKKAKKTKSKTLLKNAKSTLLEFCQENSFPKPEYKTLSQQGPDHKPLFTARVILKAGENSDQFRNFFKLKSNQKLKIYADGIGKKIKKAEMKAAQKICKKIGLTYSV